MLYIFLDKGSINDYKVNIMFLDVRIVKLV